MKASNSRLVPAHAAILLLTVLLAVGGATSQKPSTTAEPTALPRSSASQTTQSLTEGQKKAIKGSEDLEEATVAIYDKDGKMQSTKRVSEAIIPESLAEYVKSQCKDPRPISPRCVVCTDGTIICAKVSKWANKDTSHQKRPT